MSSIQYSDSDSDILEQCIDGWTMEESSEAARSAVGSYISEHFQDSYLWTVDNCKQSRVALTSASTQLHRKPLYLRQGRTELKLVSKV